MITIFTKFQESNSRNCNVGVLLAVIVMYIDAFPLRYVTLDNRGKNARFYEQLYVITTKGNSIVHREGRSGVNFENKIVPTCSWGHR